MKKLYFACLVVLFSIGVNAQTQYYDDVTYFHYLDSTSEWYIKSYDWIGGVHSYRTEYFDGDTTINGIGYYKKYYVESNSLPDTVGRTFMRFVREDSNNIFYYGNDWGSGFSEWPAFDFSPVALGDTLQGNYCFVTGIDTILLGSIPLWKYKTNGVIPSNGGLVEGIGLALAADLCMAPIEGGPALYCYRKGNDWTCFDPNADITDYPPALRLGDPTGLNELKPISIKLFPNPAQDYFIISTQGNYTKADVAIYSVQGILVNKQTVNIANGLRIGLEGLSKGLYSVLVTDTQGKILGKDKLAILK
jgi:hypothetical protein